MFEDIFYRYGTPHRLVSDGGPENRSLSDKLLRRYGIRYIWTSRYYPQANGIVERGYQPVVNALAKYTLQRGLPWVDALHAMLWADRTTVKRTTGMTPARAVYGAEHIIPIETEEPT